MSVEDPKAGTEGAPSKSEPFLDPTKVRLENHSKKEADRAAENDFKLKYGIKKAPPGIAQRKISATGGKQYFDSGDYNKSANRKDRQAIASHPHAMNPHLAQMRGKGGIHKPPPPSKLVAAEPKSPTKSPLAN